MGETAVEQVVKIDDSTEQTEKVGTLPWMSIVSNILLAFFILFHLYFR